MSFSRIFIFLCLFFVGGIFLASSIDISRQIMLGFFILGILLFFFLWGHKTVAVAGLCVMFLFLGIARYQFAELIIEKNELKQLNDLNIESLRSEAKMKMRTQSSSPITLIGTIAEEPDERKSTVRLTVNVESFQQQGNAVQPVQGKVLITAGKYPEYKYADRVKITGKLDSPPVFDGYKDYLKKDGIYSVMNWPKIELVERNSDKSLVSFVQGEILVFKKSFQEIGRNFISPPQEGFFEALVFGNENNISDEWKEKLNLTGTRHIAAVSGMNITIIASLILSSMLYFGLDRRQAFYFSAGLLVLYILMIGAPASAVRAGIMAGILITAQYFGRLSSASRSIVIAAFLMLLINPFLLKSDIGFQLSFLAFLGIIYLQPAIVNFLKNLPDPKIFPLRATLATTLAAQIFTFPVLIYNFGFISLISPIANILIVPFLAPITILIFIFGIGGMIFWPLGFILSVPVWFSLSYIVKIIEIFSEIPYATLRLEEISWVFISIFYLILGFIIWRLQKGQGLKFFRNSC